MAILYKKYPYLPKTYVEKAQTICYNFHRCAIDFAIEYCNCILAMKCVKRGGWFI